MKYLSRINDVYDKGKTIVFLKTTVLKPDSWKPG